MNMNNERKQTPLMQVTWDATYTQHREGICIGKNVTTYWSKELPTTTVGFLVYEDEHIIALAASIYGILIPNFMAKNIIEIPKNYVIERKELDPNPLI